MRATALKMARVGLVGLASLGVLIVAAPSALATPGDGSSPLPRQQQQETEDLTIHLIVSLARTGISDQALTAIVRDNGKQFTMSAEDILFLRDQGVSEAVIRAMLGEPSGAEPGGTEPPREQPSPSAPLPAPSPPPPAELSTASTPHGAPPAFGFEAAASLPVEVRGLHEETSTEHEHSVVAHGGIGLLFVRAEDGYPTTHARAEEAARAFEIALRTPGASIELRWTAGEPSVWVRANSDEYLLLRVGSADATGYSRHGAAVEPALLAAWWGALLSDYVGVVRDGIAPRLLVDDDLAALAEAIRARSAPGAPVSVEALGAALLTLNAEVRERLEELGHSVPEDFSLPILPGGRSSDSR